MTMATDSKSNRGTEHKTFISNWFVEKSQCYQKQEDDRFACKAMLLTAKTMYPQDLEIQVSRGQEICRHDFVRVGLSLAV